MNERHSSDESDFAERFRREYQKTPLPGPEERRRLTTAIGAAAPPRRDRFGLGGWLEPRTITARPAVVMATAVALLGIGALVARISFHGRAPTSAPQGSTASLPTHAVRFVLAAPGAGQVALVGDFNEWDARATPMRYDAGQNEWSVTVPLASGWHAYAFVVDGSRWVHDPGAPLAPPDELGGPRSVVVVGEAGI